jgi:geranylgeranyl diphosphate synthase type II
MLHRAMRYSVFAGGKRLRPALVLTACQVAGGRAEEAIDAACAIEMIHTYSLVHDDLPAMDDDDLRRGKPSCHKAFGEARAILVGDALQALAFEVLAGHKDPAVTPALVRELASVAGSRGMVGGQVLDMEASEETGPAVLDTVEAIHRSKTGALLCASVRMGGMCAGADRRVMEALSRFGQSIGLAFQIADDILDVVGDQEALGKTAGKDQAQNKATWPAAVGLDASRCRATELMEQAETALAALGDAARPLCDLARFVVERQK